MLLERRFGCHAYSLDKAMKMYARIRSLDEVAAMLRA
jgi:hypothetical protein